MFDLSASVLDTKRLGKQRVECLQLLNAIYGISDGWINHPCTRMWRKYPDALALYGRYICKEWIKRGYKDNCLVQIMNFYNTSTPIMPPWLGDEIFHSSHRGNLLRKYPEWYSAFKWTDSPLLPYVWPV